MQNRNGISNNSRLGLTFWMVTLYFLFEYARPQDVIPALAGLRIPLMLTLTLPVIWLVWGDKRALKDPLLILYVAFIGLCAVSVFWAANQFWVVETTKFMTALLIAGTLPAAGLLNDRRRLSAFFTIWVLIHVFVAYISATNEGRGAGSFLADENDMALTINMAIPYAYFLMQSRERGLLFKAVMIGAIAIMVAAVIISDSRGGFIGLVAVTCGILFFTRHRIRNALFIAMVGGIAFINLPEHYVGEMQTITDQNDSTRNERLYSWGLGWRMFLEHPIAGVGASNYPWRISEYEARFGEYTGRRGLGGRVAHSLYFTLIPELGMVGIALFASMTFMIFRRLRGIVRQEDREAVRLTGSKSRVMPSEAGLLGRAMLVSMFGLFTSGAFISVLYYPHFWFLIGFVLALQYATQDVRLKHTGLTRAQMRQLERDTRQAIGAS